MCGITGFFDATQSMSRQTMTSVLQNMVQRLVHRGPDHSGIWIDAETGIALGHRRLAILDVSPEGHQPMVSKNDRYVIVFNGEIYNFAALKRELEQRGHRFRGHSDTEVMLAAFCEWGVQQAIARMNGMFAFALWDQREGILHLGRDLLGEKPLYYGWLGQTLIFGSELKALQAHPHFQADINRDALALFLRYSYVPAPDSIYQNVYKLPPGTILSWRGGTDRPEPIAYWSAQTIAEAGDRHPFAGSEADATAHLEALLRDAIALRMVADVPLGSFISGGVDSSTVVALMQAQSQQAVKTFTIGFYEDAYNEAHYAKAVAQHLGTDHTELYVTPAETLAVIPNLPTLYDEPFADASQVPTFLVSELARQQVTVCLSGDGGDELFGGYKRYFIGRRIWQTLGWLPVEVRHKIASAIVARSPQVWDQRFAHLHPYLPTQARYPTIGDDLHKLAGVLAAANPDVMYAQLASHWQEESLVIGAKSSYRHHSSVAQLSDFTQRMMFLDLVTYLPDDILVKVDRASMGVSLEARVPLLDHRVVEFAWQLPLSMKIRHGQSKWLLRQVLYKYVPQALIERPKSGFGIPIDRWLRDPLRDWAEALLDEQRLRQEGFLNPIPIRKKWAEHLSGDRNWQHHLWDVLMFQAWLEQSRCALPIPTCV